MRISKTWMKKLMREWYPLQYFDNDNSLGRRTMRRANVRLY
jgi:hypothetical protein